MLCAPEEPSVHPSVCHRSILLRRGHAVLHCVQTGRSVRFPMPLPAAAAAVQAGEDAPSACVWRSRARPGPAAVAVWSSAVHRCCAPVRPLTGGVRRGIRSPSLTAPAEAAPAADERTNERTRAHVERCTGRHGGTLMHPRY